MSTDYNTRLRKAWTKRMEFLVLLQSLAILLFSSAFLLWIKYIRRRYLYSRVVPCVRNGLIDFKGDLKFMRHLAPKDSYSPNVFVLELVGGYAQLFKEKELLLIWLSYTPFIICFKAEAVEELISGTKVMEKAFSYDLLHPWLGTGLLTSHGTKWKSRRKLLTPSFHFDILKEFLPIFNEQSRILVNLLKDKTKEPWIDVVKPITLCSLDIICETTLGYSINAQEHSESEYVQAVKRAADAIFQRSISPLLWSPILFRFSKLGRQFEKDLKLLHNFTRSVIKQKKEQYSSNKPMEKRRKAFLDLLLEHHIHNGSLSEEDVREEVDTFAFEGHDTTSMGMSWALYLIGLYEDVQNNIHEELDQIFGTDTERDITTDDLKDMKYLERVLKESQRLYPSVPIFARQVNKDMTIRGYKVPKGMSCVVYAYYLHRDEKVFPNPEVFDPDRFLPENSLNRHPYAYVPFSAGPRNCIGQRFAVMEEKVVIADILRNYNLKSLQSRDQIQPAPELILKTLHPIKIKFSHRNSNTSL